MPVSVLGAAAAAFFGKGAATFSDASAGRGKLVELRKSHSVPGRKVSLQMSADRFSSDGAENVG